MNTTQREETSNVNNENNGNGKNKIESISEENNTGRTSLESQNNGNNHNSESFGYYIDIINKLRDTVENLETKLRTMEKNNSSPDKELNATKDENSQKINALEEKIKQMKEENSLTINKMKEENSQNSKKINDLETEINSIKEENSDLTSAMIDLKTRMLELEILAKRSNINIDLLANRDTLKSILLLLSFNLGVTTKNEIEKINEKLIYQKKFSFLVISVLKKLNELLHPIAFKRGGIGNTITLTEEKKEFYLNEIKFVECIHFIVCSIDNIVHSQKEEEEEYYSKIIGNRSEEILKKSLIQFFNDPKNMDELKILIKEEEKIKNKEKENNDNKTKSNKSTKSPVIDENIIKEEKNKYNIIEENENMKNDNKISIEEKKNNEVVINAEKDDTIVKEKNQNLINEIKGNDKNPINVTVEEKNNNVTDIIKQNNELIYAKEEKKEYIKGRFFDINENKVKIDNLISFESYYFPKNKAYLENKKYYKALKGENTYSNNQFFIQYLFDPNKESFSNTTFNMNYDNFILMINETIEKFKEFKINITPSDLIKNLRWLS